MRRTGLIILALGLVLLVSSLSFASGQKIIEMKLAHYGEIGHPSDLAANMFAEAVEKRTNGAITVTVYPANQLGSPPEQLEQNILGVVDMSLPTQGALDKYSLKFAAVMLPFVFTDYEHAYRVLDGPFMDWAAPDLEEQGLLFLSNWEWGFRNITNRVRPVYSPDDVKGLKLRTPPEIQLESAMEALGAVVTKIAFPELYMALKQGVVDGQENPLSVIYHFRLFEVQKYLALTRHVYNSMVHVMSLKSWNKLTPDQQRIIREESKKAGDFMRKRMQEEEEVLVAKLEKEGMIITRVDASEFQAKMEPAYKRIGKYAGEENVEKFRKMAESLR